MDLSLVLPAAHCHDVLPGTVAALVAFLDARWPGAFEVLVVPNGRGDTARTFAAADALAARFPPVRVVRYEGPPGKGAAVRAGLREARGRWVAFTDADLPYELEFLERAVPALEAGAALVAGVRAPAAIRAPGPLRALLSLGFNRVVRRVLPIDSRDTQAGMKVLARDFARVAAARLRCPGFYFDLELLLVARAHRAPHVELPVRWVPTPGRSTVSVRRELVQAPLWLWRIRAHHARGGYDP